MAQKLTQLEQEIVEDFIAYIDTQVKEMKRRKSTFSLMTAMAFIASISRQAAKTKSRLQKDKLTKTRHRW